MVCHLVRSLLLFISRSCFIILFYFVNLFSNIVNTDDTVFHSYYLSTSEKNTTVTPAVTNTSFEGK